jgi:hypothetical protein
MANSPRITAAVANAALDAAYEPAADSGQIQIYDGTQPAAGGGALSGNTLLATLTLNATAFPSASGGVLTANAITSATAVATSTATWFRMTKSDGTTVLLDGSVGTSGADLNLNSTSIVSGGNVAVTSFTITLPLL